MFQDGGDCWGCGFCEGGRRLLLKGLRLLRAPPGGRAGFRRCGEKGKPVYSIHWWFSKQHLTLLEIRHAATSTDSSSRGWWTSSCRNCSEHVLAKQPI
ncbi:unnamed protein product [Caretta caretta]